MGSRCIKTTVSNRTTSPRCSRAQVSACSTAAGSSSGSTTCSSSRADAVSLTLPDELVEPAPEVRPHETDGAPIGSPGRALVDWVAGNRLFAAALAGATVLRILVAVAYAPAL